MRGIILGLGRDISRLFSIIVLQPRRVEHENIGHVIEEQRGWRRNLDIDCGIVHLLDTDIERNIAAQR